MLCCLAVQLQWLIIGVTTKDPDSGPVPRGWGDIVRNDQCWAVYIRGNDGCIACHGQRRVGLQWVLDR